LRVRLGATLPVGEPRGWSLAASGTKLSHDADHAADDGQPQQEAGDLSETHAAAEGKGALVDRNVAKNPTSEPVTENSSNYLLWELACKPPAAAKKQ